jgi:hypothetical protein
MLKLRDGDVERGIAVVPKRDRVTFDEAADDMLNDYKTNRKEVPRRLRAAPA